MGGMAMLIGRTLLGGIAARVGLAGAFGAIGLGILGPATLIGGTVAGWGTRFTKLDAAGSKTLKRKPLAKNSWSI